MTTQRRYELTDSEWEQLKKNFPEREAGDLGRPKNDDRKMINGARCIAALSNGKKKGCSQES